MKSLPQATKGKKNKSKTPPTTEVIEDVENDNEGNDEDGEDEDDEENTLPAPVLKRVLALRKIHESVEAVDEEYKAERIQLEIKYREKRQAYFEERRKFIIGEVDVPTEIKEEGAEEGI